MDEKQEPHLDSDVCPHCGEDASKTALVDLVYTYEICDCDGDTFRHLVKTLWHKEHFLAHYASKGAR